MRIYICCLFPNVFPFLLEVYTALKSSGCRLSIPSLFCVAHQVAGRSSKIFGFPSQQYEIDRVGELSAVLSGCGHCSSFVRGVPIGGAPEEGV